MSMLDSSFMAPIVEEMDMSEDMSMYEMCDMICEAIRSLNLESNVTEYVAAPAVSVTNEMNMEDMCAKLDSIDHNLGVLITLLAQPVTRTVTRENGQITSMIEKRI